MNFREEYGDYSVQEAVDAIILILKRGGAEVDDKSFTWTLVGALFDNGIISRTEFESIYYLLKSHKPEREKVAL
ncbi:MAG TPA: hypothetical protein VLB01_05090 [Thermodesulfobacteriota bacterium]|nr:hypothetical protein [Thermodesulfobacteriota bacterium]